MPTYLFELSYTSESIAAQIKKPQDRLKTAAIPALEAAGGTLLGGGFSLGDQDVVILYDAPNDQTAAALNHVVSAGGSVKSVKTTKLLSGSQWTSALRKAGKIASAYKPAK
jgi:uncharacterized protein with GYD domain